MQIGVWRPIPSVWAPWKTAKETGLKVHEHDKVSMSTRIHVIHTSTRTFLQVLSKPSSTGGRK